MSLVDWEKDELIKRIAKLEAENAALRKFAHSIAGLPACLEYAYAHGLLDADGKTTALLTGEPR